MHIFPPFSLAPASSDTTLAFTALHLQLDGYFLFFLKDYKRDQHFVIFSDYFKLAFQCMPHLLESGLFRMVFEDLRNCFHPKDLTSGFFLVFELYIHITQGHNPPQIAYVLGVVGLLGMTKHSSGVRPIIVQETLY
jgi:hypothetical protein